MTGSHVQMMNCGEFWVCRCLVTPRGMLAWLAGRWRRVLTWAVGVRQAGKARPGQAVDQQARPAAEGEQDQRREHPPPENGHERATLPSKFEPRA